MQTITSELQNLPFALASFTFHLTARDRLELPEYKGSAFRGGFGHIMKKVSCVLSQQQCASQCQLGNSCAYGYVFETPQSDGTRKPIEATNLPHPFVILPPLTPRELIEPGDALAFGLTLIGKGIDFLPYFIYAFDELGHVGLGRGRGRYRLERVVDGAGQEIYDSGTKTLSGDFEVKTYATIVTEAGQLDPQRLSLRFISPTRITEHGKTIHRLPFDLLLRNLLRRGSLLAQLHCGEEWALDYHALIDQSSQHVQMLSCELEPRNWERFSNRQNRRMRIDSFMGQVSYTGELAPYLPLIQLGHYMHVGGKTTFGMGKYSIGS